jgi:hypothetical protein
MHAFVDRVVALESDVGSAELFRDILQLWTRRPGWRMDSGTDQPVLTEIVRRFEQHEARGGHLADVPARAAVLFLSGVFGYLVGVDDDEGRAEGLHVLVRLHLGADS